MPVNSSDTAWETGSRPGFPTVECRVPSAVMDLAHWGTVPAFVDTAFPKYAFAVCIEVLLLVVLAFLKY